MKKIKINIDKIIEKLNQKGWTYTYLAQKAGIRPSAVSMILNSQRTPRIETLFNIAFVLKISFSKLILWEKDAKNKIA